MKTELENNKITNGFITPNDYFDNLSDRIIEKINGEASSNLIPKTSGFSVPEDYFVKNEAKWSHLVNHQSSRFGWWNSQGKVHTSIAETSDQGC